MSNKKTQKSISNKIRVMLILSLIFILTFVSLVSINLVSAQLGEVFSKSNIAISPSSGDVGFPFLLDKEMCKAGQDFIIQVSPTGCVPSVVRSDLLEEQNVPVFCPIVATQINPLIDIESIRSMIFSFLGEHPSEVSGVGYYPARAALGKTGQVTQPLMNNLGYAVIVLRQQRNESTMPDFVTGNLTATIRYDIKNAFGVGQAVFYLPEITNDEEWNQNYKRYSFWDGRGYLRAENIGDDRATISIYSDRETYGLAKTDKRKIATTILEPGKKSNEIYMPGFDYCLGTMQLKLNGLENPDTRVRLNINGDITEVQDEEKFLDSKCTVKEIEKNGINEKIIIKCNEDEGGRTHTLTINPRITLDIGGTSKDYGVGDWLYKTDEDKKSVYLGFVGTTDDSSLKTSLYVRLITLPEHKEKLSEEEISSVARYDKGVKGSKFDKGLLEKGAELGKEIWTKIPYASKKFIKGKELGYLEFGKTENISGTDIGIVGFASAIDKDLLEFPSEFRKYYENAIEDYDEILKIYSKEKYPPDTEQKTLGEQALSKKIELAWEALQRKTTKELCDEFEEKYPLSPAPAYCEEAHKLSSVAISSSDVVIDGTVYRIALDRIKEPSFDEFGATILIKYPKEAGETEEKLVEYNLTKNEFIYLNEETNEFIQLVDVDENSVKIKTNLNAEETSEEKITEKIKRALIDETKTLKIGSPESFGSSYLFTLEKVNQKKLAKVSVIPNIKYTQTEANFSFKIGIEKRAIQLSPEKINQKIVSLNNTIAKFKGISDKIGKLVETGKIACGVTGAGLVVKNFFANLKGEGIARQKLMRGAGGWYDRCEAEVVPRGNYKDIDSCLLAKNSEIEASVNEYAKIIKEQNEKFEELQKEITKKRFLGEDVVDTEKLMKKYVNDDYRNGLNSDLQSSGINKITVGNTDVDVSDIIKLITSGTVSITQARNIELNARLLNSENAVVKKIAENEIKADLGKVWSNYENEIEKQNAKDLLSEVGLPGIGVDFYSRKGSIEGTYDGWTIPSGGVGEIPGGVSAKSIIYGGQVYILQLERVGADKYRVVEIYNTNKNKLDKEGKDKDIYNEIQAFSFKYYDSNTYKNKCPTCVARYYTSGQYAGLPAIVPFDIENGWYAATKPAVPIFGGIQPYQESGRISNFYLCNVGANGREEFYATLDFGTGDDICRGFVYGASQPPDFPELSPAESLNKRTRAEEALIEAQRAYKPGATQINLFGQKINVGEPAVGIPDIQCQDFMSSADCNLLFNVCDPFICPSSRCDLGGTYPVSDVIQSGLVGSIALCMPNFKLFGGDVYIPVCLSGIHAGLEAYLSVLDSYQQCLKASSETGQTIGICDEIHSVYMCDFYWRQSLPLVKYAIPNVIGSILGMNVRGGGEYISFQDAWKRAGDSIGFFTQYYAANSFKAFKARSAEDIGTEICKNWVSIVAPGNGELFDALVKPDVPAQFYGRFDEIPFTTATVPPISHYKVFYHIYAGKDLPAYYQVYLRGTGETFYRDVPMRRMVATGFIKTGEYATKTEDFTAPSGYNELCIVVNNREECGFKQVTTEFGINWITEEYLKQQASQTDIKTEAACVSGTVNLYSLLNPVTAGQILSSDSFISSGVAAGSEIANPAIYNRGITRVCSTDNPGKATDRYIETENQRWVDVGYCDSSKIRCWIDTNSVKETIKMTSIEEDILEDVTKDHVDTLLKEAGYVESFDGLVKEIEAEKNLSKKIEIISKKFIKVFYMNEKGYLTLLRADAYAWLAFMEKYLVEMKIPEPETPLILPEEEEPSTGTTPSAPTTETCSTQEECKKLLGEKIIEIAKEEMEKNPNVDYSTVTRWTGAKSFECLVLQVARLESNIQHCKELFEDENPLYCEGKIDELIGGDEKNSLGIMQINIQAHPDVDVTDFEENVRKGVDLLIKGYSPSEKVYSCYMQEDKKFVSIAYSGWQRALRNYNGWNTKCKDENGNIIGNPRYVTDVLNYRYEIEDLFPETCYQPIPES